MRVLTLIRGKRPDGKSTLILRIRVGWVAGPRVRRRVREEGVKVEGLLLASAGKEVEGKGGSK